MAYRKKLDVSASLRRKNPSLIFNMTEIEASFICSDSLTSRRNSGLFRSNPTLRH